jgi:isopenicillin N synthase-like dioxygenase
VSFAAKSLEATSLPVIDIAGLRSPQVADRMAVAAEIRAACLDKGFFYIRNHGVSPDLQTRLFSAMKRFFALAEDEKSAIDKKRVNTQRGYEPLRRQTLEPGTPPDLKEGFQMGADLPPDHPSIVGGRYGAAPNQWPANLPGFRETLLTYHAAMLELESVMWRGLALSLDLAEDYFGDFCHDALANLRILHYPPQPANPLPDEKGCGAHTDFGGMTMLLQDENGGLQVWDGKGEWLHAPPIPDTYIVNLGDMVARWTNDRYRSTVHRVVNLSGRERYSAPFFFSGNPDYVVSCLPTCLDPGEAPSYPPVRVADHMTLKFRTTYQ